MQPPTTRKRAEEAEPPPALRELVRSFVTEWFERTGAVPVVDAVSRAFDPSFSRELGARGWIRADAGRGTDTGAVDRFTVMEELLAAGAPVAGHWVAERQFGPMLGRFGTEDQRTRFLPRIARGELVVALGFSEPESGSDLASVRTRAERVDGGWRLSGRKIWTSKAHQADLLVVLCRTHDDVDDRHAGLSQLIVELPAPGVDIRPIQYLNQERWFNEVTFDHVHVPDGMVLGTAGEGWSQVTSELLLERAAPDRYLSAFPLVQAYWRYLVARAHHPSVASDLGIALSELDALRTLSFEVAGKVDGGGPVSSDAVLVKYLGTSLEQRLVELIRADLEGDPSPPDQLSTFSRDATDVAPSFTIRGGTNEILTGLVYRTITATHPPVRLESGDVGALVGRVLAEEPGGTSIGAPPVAAAVRGRWDVLEDLGVVGVALTVEAGEPVGDARDVADILRQAGYHASPTFLGERLLSWGPVLAASGLRVPDGCLTAPDLRVTHRTGLEALEPLQSASSRLVGRVPDADAADWLLLVGGDADQPTIVALPPDAYVVGATRQLDRLSQTVEVPPGDLRPYALGSVDSQAVLDLARRSAAARCLLMDGALHRLLEVVAEHATTRRQFGRPIGSFQAVQRHVVGIAAMRTLARMATQKLLSPDDPDGALRVAMAKCVCSLASGRAVAHAHQVLGAGGLTAEHPAHALLAALRVWREDHRSERHWGRWIVAHVRSEGVVDLWARLTRGDG